MPERNPTAKFDLAGQVFERLTVLGKSDRRDKSRVILWRCLCECGNEIVARAASLKSGRVRSCGCWARERVTTHGMTNTPTYKSWRSMLGRCRNPNDPAYHNYGGRGITVCERWNQFENFLADMGEMPEGLTIERGDNNAGYSPTNCVWATRTTQARNTRFNRMITFQGVTLCMKEWSERLGIPYVTLYTRFAAGWSIERALSTPVQRHVK